MTERDRPQFAEAMHAMAETFNEPVSEIRAEAYFDALRDLPLERVNAAVRLALRTCRFFPKPVDLRELVEGSADQRADFAWGEVLSQIRRVGYMGTPTFIDPSVAETVRQVWGHWRRLCETLPAAGPELVGWMKQFKAAYGTVSARDAIAGASFAQLPEGLRQDVKAIAESKSWR